MKTSCICALLLLVCVKLHGQPQAHSNGQSVTGNITPSLTVPSFSVPASKDRLLIACTVNAVNAAAPSLTFGGNAMTSAISRNTTSGLRLSMYYLPLGTSISITSGDIVATGSGLLQLGAASYFDVDQLDPTDGEVSAVIPGGAASSSLVISSGATKLPCDCIGGFASGFTNFTADPGQTQILQSNASSPNTRLAISNAPGTASTNMLWTINGDFTGGTGSHVGINIRGEAALPVKLIRFSARESEGNAKLDWQTSEESNSSHFAIYRSPDGRKFNMIGRVEAAGTSFDNQSYTFTDAGLSLFASPLVYYRLRSEDLDGSYSESKIVALQHVLASSSIALYPNPLVSDRKVKINTLLKSSQVSVWNQLGRQIEVGVSNPGPDKTELDLGVAPAGTYLIKMTDKTVIQTQKVVVK